MCNIISLMDKYFEYHIFTLICAISHLDVYCDIDLHSIFLWLWSLIWHGSTMYLFLSMVLHLISWILSVMCWYPCLVIYSCTYLGGDIYMVGWFLFAGTSFFLDLKNSPLSYSSLFVMYFNHQFLLWTHTFGDIYYTCIFHHRFFKFSRRCYEVEIT